MKSDHFVRCRVDTVPGQPGWRVRAMIRFSNFYIPIKTPIWSFGTWREAMDYATRGSDPE
jgi:hypothetical protein